MILPTLLLLLACSQLTLVSASPVLHRRVDDNDLLVKNEPDEPIQNGLDNHWVIVIIVVVVLIACGVVGTCIWAKLRQRRRLQRERAAGANRRISSTSAAPLQEKNFSPSPKSRQSPIPEPVPALTYDGPYRGFKMQHTTR